MGKRNIHVKNPDELAKEFGFSDKKKKKKQKRRSGTFLSDEEDADNNFLHSEHHHTQRCHYCTINDLSCDFNGFTCETCRKNGISCMKYSEAMDNAALHYKMMFGEDYERLLDFNNRLLFQERIIDRQRKEHRESGEVHDRKYHLAKMTQERSDPLWSKRALKGNKRASSSSSTYSSNSNATLSKRTRLLSHNNNNNL